MTLIIEVFMAIMSILLTLIAVYKWVKFAAKIGFYAAILTSLYFLFRWLAKFFREKEADTLPQDPKQ